MVVVTHEMGFARSAANRVVFMDAGQIVELAPPDEFFSDPRTERAQDFLSKILRPLTGDPPAPAACSQPAPTRTDRPAPVTVPTGRRRSPRTDGLPPVTPYRPAAPGARLHSAPPGGLAPPAHRPLHSRRRSMSAQKNGTSTVRSVRWMRAVGAAAALAGALTACGGGGGSSLPSSPGAKSGGGASRPP